MKAIIRCQCHVLKDMACFKLHGNDSVIVERFSDRKIINESYFTKNRKGKYTNPAYHRELLHETVIHAHLSVQINCAICRKVKNPDGPEMENMTK